MLTPKTEVVRWLSWPSMSTCREFTISPLPPLKHTLKWVPTSLKEEPPSKFTIFLKLSAELRDVFR